MAPIYSPGSPSVWRRIFRFVAFALLVILFSCQTRHSPPIRVGANYWPGYELLFLAKNLGYYEEKNIEIVRYPSSTDAMRAFRNGLIDGVAVTMDEALLLQSGGSLIKVALIFDISNGGDAIIGQKGVRSMKDLKGKKVGVENTALGAYMLTRALQENEMELSDIVIVPMAANEHIEAFKGGKVNAVVTFEPARSTLISYGNALLFDSSQIPGEIIDGLALRDGVIDGRPGVVRSLVDGYFKAFEYMKSNRPEALRKMALSARTDQEKLGKSLDGLILAGREENRRMLNPGDTALSERVRTLAEVMREKKLLDGAADLPSLFESSFVR